LVMEPSVADLETTALDDVHFSREAREAAVRELARRAEAAEAHEREVSGLWQMRDTQEARAEAAEADRDHQCERANANWATAQKIEDERDRYREALEQIANHYDTSRVAAMLARAALATTDTPPTERDDDPYSYENYDESINRLAAPDTPPDA
jgi:hypothetical protein